jgi:cysteinyl-tRNA synthetase
MAEKLFGKRFDIHGGGLDLAFPHHENEKAQSCSCGVEEDFAQVWMHNEMLQVEGKKMSKSLGNFFSVRELIDQGYSGEVIRLVFLGTHYRKPMDWTDKKAREAEVTLRRAAKLLSSDPSNILVLKAPQEFVNALANDLNTSLALTFIKKYIKEVDRIKLASSLTLLGFDIDVLVKNFASLVPSQFKNVQMEENAPRLYGDAVDSRLSELANQLLVRRENAMLTKDFTTVDAFKSALIDAGVNVQMSKDGVTLEPATGFDASKLEDLL